MTEDRTAWLAEYRLMLLLRRSEEAVQKLMKQGALPGFVHLYIGEEASAVGVCGALEPGDMVFSTHRPHGHGLARGADLTALYAELFGFREGLCAGMGGSMHVADVEHGFFGGNGIVGAGLALGLGPALRAQVVGTRDVSVIFFGDGASNEGAFHEALNLASLWRLPVVFVCEDDGYAQATPREFHQTVSQVADRAASYGIPSEVVDGQDVGAVRRAAVVAVTRAREGSGPTLIECMTRRYVGHFEGDAQRYRRAGELEDARARDPIEILGAWLVEGGVTREQLDEIDGAVRDEIAAAIAAARQGSPPDGDRVTAYVYATAV